MSSKVDLHQLATERNGPKPKTPFGSRRRVVTRFVLPGLLLVGFVTLIVFALWDTLNPPREVTVLPVIVAQAEMQQAGDTPIFRAAGWAEPRPAPILVTAQAEGVVDKILVVEGQDIKEDEIVARLVPTDARLALDAADAEVKLREGELRAAKVGLVAAKTRLDQPLHLKVELADAKAALAKAAIEQANLPHRLRAAQGRHAAAKTDWEAKQKLSAALPQPTLLKAEVDLIEANAAVEELTGREKRLADEVEALTEKRDALALKLGLKTDELRLAGESEAAVQIAEARLAQSVSLRDAARLRLERMEIKSPSSGRVMAVPARRGTKLSGSNPGSPHDSSTVLTLYDPANLQIRVDVRLDDVHKVMPGQKAKIECAAAPGTTLDGEVLVVTSQADVSKNTLQVKVSVKNPPGSLRPDMLCQVTFLAVPAPVKKDGKDYQPFRLLVPRQLIDASTVGNRIWVADQVKGRAHLRRIEVGLTIGELVEVFSGLSSTDRLVVGGREGIREGDRIRVVSEDDTLGITASSTRKKSEK